MSADERDNRYGDWREAVERTLSSSAGGADPIS
jgi:hypothetical protein